MAAFDSVLNDPYISNLLSTPSSLRQRPSALNKHMTKMPSPPLSGPVPNLIQFLESVPPPVTLLLVEIAPAISRLRWVVEVVSWKSHWTESWLALAAWWALCLSTNAILRYLLPFSLLLPALLPYLPSRQRATALQPPPTTEYMISLSLSDLSTLRTLLPSFPILPSMSFTTALRVSAILYLPYILFIYLIPMPILLGVVGTLLITYRAPWAKTIRIVLWRSAHVRRFLLQLWTILSGSTSLIGPSSTQSPSPSTSQFESASALAPPQPPVRFLFTILECQRWWMGLDWTAALLPGERPSWCCVSHQPVSPPSAFSLPPPTSVYLAAPSGKRVKRTATWRWEDAEWGIMINKDGKGVNRVERKPPGLEEEEGGSRIATKAASILKERKATMGPTNEVTPGKDDREPSTGAGAGPGAGQGGGEEQPTDTDGWIYGDNKWESTSAKGGMGKYTRYRRWTRIAVLEETVEEVGPGELGIVKELEKRATPAGEEGSERPNARQDGDERGTKNPESPQKGHKRNGSRGSGGEADSVLTQRLKSAVKGIKNF